MNVILIFMTGTLMGAFNFTFFLLGYFLRGKKEDEGVVTVTEQNKEYLKELMEWQHYGGVNENRTN